MRAAEHDSGGSGRAPREVWGTGWARAGTGQAVSPARGGARRGGGCATEWARARARSKGEGSAGAASVGKREAVHDGGVEGVDAGDGFDAVGKMPTDATSTGMGRALMRDCRAGMARRCGIGGEARAEAW